MKLIWLVFLVAVLHAASAGRNKKVPKPVNVNDMCAAIKCPEGKVCRVMEKCGKKRKTQAKCLSCVPPGVDKVCNDNLFLRAVLGGSPRKPTALYCHVNDVPNKFECPIGSVCVELPDSPGNGVCCYGSVFVIFGKKHSPISNNDPQCSRCKPECSEGYDCKEDVECGKLSHVCKPQEKPGLCPVYTLEPDYVCEADDRRKQCDHDQDCPGAKKCCRKACGGTYCEYAFLYKK